MIFLIIKSMPKLKILKFDYDHKNILNLQIKQNIRQVTNSWIKTT